MKNKVRLLLKENVFFNLNYSQSKNQFELFRVGIGIFSLINFSLFLIDHEVFLDPDCIINWDVTNANSFWYELHLLKISNTLNIGAYYLLYFFSSIYILSLLLLTLGIFTRIASILSFLFFLLFSVQLYPFLYGVDLYQSVLLLFLMVFPTGYSLSVKPRKSTKEIIDQQKVGVRSIQLYLSITYFSAGFGKIKMSSWLNGNFIFLSISDPTYRLIDFPDIFQQELYVIIGITVAIIELTYCILILIPYARSILVLTIIFMHMFISIYMGLIPFGFLLILANFLSWYPLLAMDYNSVSKKIPIRQQM